jgi:hypothetical protein
MNDAVYLIELFTWATYFGVGTLLLIVLLLGRRELIKRDKKRQKAEKLMHLRHASKSSEYGTRRVI